MTQIFTGTGLGLHGSSLSQLGNYGPKGTARLGQGGGSMYVNAANGNLVLKQSDGFLANAGVGLDLFQTYNSRSTCPWQFNTETHLTFESPSSIQRTDEDGHQSRFIYNAQQNAYLAEDGSTARLTFDGISWNYREGSSQTTCLYNAEGQLTSLRDNDGHVLRFSYQNGQLTSITDNSDRQTITWSFDQGLLRDVTAQSDGQTIHHLHYDYDAQNRLNRINQDLGDGKIYWTAYDYEGDSSLISDIRQSDGVNLHLDYDAEGRIKRLIDDEGRFTTYDYFDGKTIITNGLGESWTYYYDAEARLTGIDGPDNFHLIYHYEGKYLDSITQGTRRWQFAYNDAGDCIRVESPTGEVTKRCYDNEHHLLSETRYQTFDAGNHPTTPQTSRYVYDEQGHLRFTIAADGVVNEYRYDINGNRISSRCYLQGRWQTPSSTLNELVIWTQTQHDMSLIDYHYDWRGCLTEEIHYTQIDTQGDGIITPDTIRTFSLFDAAGRLIEKSSFNKSNLNTTHFFYDSLGRLIKTIDNQHHTQTIDYDDAHQRILKTEANGLQTLSIYDKSGLLLSTHCLDATHDYGTKSYHYNAAGQLISETDAGGKIRHLFYDAQGRLQATVSPSGQATEYVYDNEGHCIQIHQYQQTISVGNATRFATIKPATTSLDRISQSIYNQYNQVAFQIDSEGAVIAYQYDAEGRITSKTAYANRLTHFQPDRQLTIADMAITPSNEDRTITYYYDANGRMQAEINGEGAATAYRYDAQGHLIEQIRYISKVTGPRTGDWNADAPAAAGNQDIHTYSLYNIAELKIADIDPDGYLTEYRYDDRGLLIDTFAYYTKVKSTQKINASTTLDSIRPSIHTNDHHSTYRYNDLNQLKEEKTHTSLVITYDYNEQGLVINETRTDLKTHEARSQQYRYDSLGRVIQNLDALGAALLDQNKNLTQNEIETIWQQHSVSYAYDITGHLTRKTNALNEITRYVYNEAGLLTYTISPMGGVTETRYNAFQQVETTLRYSAFYPNPTQTTLADIKQAMQRLINPTLDDVTHYQYNTIGLLISQRKGSGSTQITTYNAFGERSQTAQQTGTTPDVLTNYHYDRRGLLLKRIDDVNGINKTHDLNYDSFGRVIKEIDGRLGVTTYQLSNRGDRTLIENQVKSRKFIKYDAFSRILSVREKNNDMYTYDDQNNLFTLTHVDAVPTIITTQFNAFGNQLTITDGNHNTTTYQYDARGQIKHIDAPEQAATDYTYDDAGRLTFQHDAGGHVCQFTYDADGNVLTKTIDPTGLNITTTYSYDGIGRQLQVTNADRCIQFSYDDQGNLIETRQDPDGLNLITTFDYNALGQLIRESRINPNGVDQVKFYTRDNVGRCLTSTIDPDGLNLTTTYTYDNNDNLISQTDPNHNTTYFTYDLNDRLRYRIDARGTVTEHQYDLSGPELQTITYAHQITPGVYDEAILTGIIQPDPRTDQHHFFVYDNQSRLMRSYDSLGYATELTYDANNNVLSKTHYTMPCSLTALLAGTTPEQPESTQSRTTRFAYNGLNQERFRMEPNGHITEYRYDANGQLIQQTRFVNRLRAEDLKQVFSVENIQANLKTHPEQDQHTHYTYDKAGRMALQATAAGVITAYEYDAAGNQTASLQYATRLTTSQLNDPNWPSFIQTSPNDRTTRALFDKAGRETYRISASGHVVEHRYDNAGNIIAEIVHAERWPLKTSDKDAHITEFKYDAAGRLERQTDADLHTTRYTYDQNNNLASKTEANKAQWIYHYNAANQLVETISPITTFNTYTNGVWREETRSIITKNDYDSFGNLSHETRDVGGLNQTIQYTYDANNHKLQTIYPNTTLNNASLRASNDRQELTQTLTETNVYNAFGEIIEHRDRTGFSRHFAYDALGQQTYIVDAEGYVTQYQYDAFGNVCTKTCYATRININDYSNDNIIKTTPIAPHDRHDVYVYDEDHHLIETRKDAVTSYNPRTGAYHTLSPTTRLTYNAFGEVITQAVKLTDVDWSVSTTTYDNDGLKTSTLDAENYLTTYRYNPFGLLEEETEFASRGASPTPSINDRQVSFLYNIKGQLTQKILKHVTFQRLTGNGNQYETITRDLTSSYGYDAMGNLVSTTDAEGNTAWSYYNTFNQLTAKVGMMTQAGRAATTYAYDALGQLIEHHQYANGAQSANDTGFTLNNASTDDIIQHDRYDASGHIIQKTDGTGHITQYSYDANGNVARSWQILDKGLIIDKRYTYDHENHLTQTATLNATGRMMTDDRQYNAFGDVIKTGLDGHFATQIDYDNAGRVWRSNVQGYFQIYVYDLSDHITQVVTSTNAYGAEYDNNGVDLSKTTYDTAISFNEVELRYDLQRQDNTYDALGRLVFQSRDATTSKRDKNNHVSLPRYTQAQTVDRWGNILQHTNASGYITHYDYNALNALTEQLLPDVIAVDEHGVKRTIAPVIHYAIDSLGRTIAMTDANGNTITHVFDAEGRITKDTDARGNHRDKTYNLLGQMNTQTNELGGVTRYTYDHENRLLSVTSKQTAQYYEYDGAGQLTHQNDTAGNAQTMIYDELGHLTEKTAQNITTSYEYDNAGHKIAEHDANKKTSTWRYDDQGRLQEHTDMGGHQTAYTYNKNGLVLTEKSSAGKDLLYHYYSDGKIHEYDDKQRQEVVTYGYDVEGNVASKMTSRIDDWALETDHYEYDALNRLIHVKRRKPEDTNPSLPTPDRTLLSIDYEYDAVGNIRDTQVSANYTGYQKNSQTDYFRYDENNRMTINKGQLINGLIDISNAQGTEMDYDAAGNIANAHTYENGTSQRYRYHYNTDNMLEITKKNDHDYITKAYTNGILTEETRYDNNGIATQYNTQFYKNGRLSDQTTQGANHNEISKTHYQYDDMGNLTHLSTKGSNYTQSHQYGYELWDTYLQKTDDLTLAVDGHATSYGKTTRTYDVNGLLQDINDSQAPNNATHFFASNLDGIRARNNNTDGQTSYLTVNGKTIGDLRLDKQYQQHLNVYGSTSLPESQQDNLGTYTLTAGDTLESIAQQVYGDSSLWYLIADANGITNRASKAGEKGSQLHTGTRLNIPQISKGQHNTNQTQTILSSTDWTGNINPTVSPLISTTPVLHHHNSNALLKTIAKIAVAITATIGMIMSAGALAVLAGAAVHLTSLSSIITTGLSALSGAAGLGLTATLAVGFSAGVVSSIVGQTAANLLHLQNGIDLKGALITGLGTAATAGVGQILNTSTAYQSAREAITSPSGFNVINATEMMERDALSQALTLATTRHQHFDWLELGVSTATAGVIGSQKVQTWTQTAQQKIGPAATFATTELQAVATEAATGNFNAAQVLRDNFGNAVMASLIQPHSPAQLEQTTITQEVEEGGYCPIPTEEGRYSSMPEGSWERFHREADIRRHLEGMRAKYMGGGGQETLTQSNTVNSSEINTFLNKKNVWSALNSNYETNIDFSAISKFEGGQILHGYLPMYKNGEVIGNSGVTFATGFDVGQYSEQQIQNLGFPQTLEKKLTPFAGVTKEHAKNLLILGKQTAISTEEANLIDFNIKGEHLKSTINNWNTNKLQNTPMFKDLTSSQQTVLFSRTFHQGVNMPNTVVANKFYNAALKNNWEKAEKYLRNYNVTEQYYVNRVNSEADLLRHRR